jgi:hypothetical protein
MRKCRDVVFRWNLTNLSSVCVNRACRVCKPPFTSGMRGLCISHTWHHSHVPVPIHRGREERCLPTHPYKYSVQCNPLNFFYRLHSSLLCPCVLAQSIPSLKYVTGQSGSEIRAVCGLRKGGLAFVTGSSALWGSNLYLGLKLYKIT